ncbi:MAG: lysophospholipid acyltransferase family protein [Deltaproteobacteria bacterium]|nr:lysophospholipid acyltransferase family protein [Deltaproteobacteria bacterium]
MIRYIALNAFIAIHSIFFCLWGLLISLFDKEGTWVHRYCAAPWAWVILRVCGIKVNVFGKEGLTFHTPRIYMVNHQSFFDIFILLACLPADFKFILKQELMRIPLLGPAMKGAGYIAIERNDPREAVKSMNQAAKKIKNGTSVLLFPEGTRSPDGRLQPFKKGGFSLAVKAGCDIMPVTIVGSSKIAPKGSLRIRKGTVDMHIGKPISLGSATKRDVPRLMEMVRMVMLKATASK